MSRAQRTLTTRRAAMAVAALLALAVGLAVISPAPVGVFWDDAVYVITAKALALGDGYRYIHLPEAPSATHYPPLWPLLLSVVWRIAPNFPDNVVLMKLLNPLLLAAAGAAGTLLAIRTTRVQPWVAAAVVAASIAVAPVLMLSAALMSEPLGLALTTAALVTATRMVMRGQQRDAIWTGVLVALAILARSAAIVLLAGIAIGLVWRRSRRASAIALAISVVMIAPWFWWSAAHAHEVSSVISGSYGPYSSWLIDGYRSDPSLLATVVWQNVVSAVRDGGVVLFGGLRPGARMFFTVPLLAVVIAGLVLAGRRAAPLSVTLLGYTALISVWPYAPGRFIWAFFPLYAVAALVGVLALARRMRRWPVPQRAVFVPLAFGALTLAMVVRYDVRTFQRRWYATAIERNADGMVPPVAWITRNTAPTDTIATDVHLLAYLYGNRIAVPINSLTVAEHVRGKTVAAMRTELMAIDSTYRPRWWVIASLSPERFALFSWATDSAGHVRVTAQLPHGGLAARVVGR